MSGARTHRQSDGYTSDMLSRLPSVGLHLALDGIVLRQVIDVELNELVSVVVSEYQALAFIIPRAIGRQIIGHG